MKQNILTGIRLTLVCMVVFGGLYPLAVWAVAQLAPGQGNGMMISSGATSYHVNVGQQFSKEHYFWSRPSAVAYNAAGSGGSNKGPSNPDYLAEGNARIDTFLARNPSVSRSEIPSDMVTASGSGLDPHISVEAALVQVNRIARARSLPESVLLKLIEDQTEAPFSGLFGGKCVHVLKLNLALDQVSSTPNP